MRVSRIGAAPWKLDRDAVFTDHRKGDEVVAATVVGQFCSGETGLGVLQRDRDAGEHRVRRVEHRARQIEGADLRGCRSGEGGGQQDGADEAAGFNERCHQHFPQPRDVTQAIWRT